jgi:hypothetical protein
LGKLLIALDRTPAASIVACRQMGETAQVAIAVLSATFVLQGRPEHLGWDPIACLAVRLPVLFRADTGYK